MASIPTRCPDCGELEEDCRAFMNHPVCPDCHEVIRGCIWNGGRCLDCHEARLLPYGWDIDEANSLADERYESYLLDGGPF